MASIPPSDPPSAALAAFLRGCERRGAVFAALQCGDPDRGDVALAAALRAFRAKAAALPMAEWPVRFWALLAATPQVRGEAAAGAHWPGALAGLAAPAPADRAALLLRLAGGLQEAEAAEALGIDSAAYRDALARACPRDAAGQPDAVAWRALADAIQQHLRDLPADRLARLARLREEALAGTRIPPVAERAHPVAAKKAPPRRWPWFVLLALLLLAAGAWWWWHGRAASPAVPAAAPAAQGAGNVLALPPDPVVTVAELPPSDAPATPADGADAAHAHPDFALLADGDEAAFARQADFLAWYVAGAGAQDPAAEDEADAAR